MAALRTDNVGMLSIIDGDRIPEEVPQGDVVATAKFELSAFEALDDLLQDLRILVGCLLFFCHSLFSFLRNKKAPKDFSQGANLSGCGCY